MPDLWWKKKSLISNNKPKRKEFWSRKFFLCGTNSFLGMVTTCPMGKIIVGLWDHLSFLRAIAGWYLVVERCPLCHFGLFSCHNNGRLKVSQGLFCCKHLDKGIAPVMWNGSPLWRISYSVYSLTQCYILWAWRDMLQIECHLGADKFLLLIRRYQRH